MDIAEWLDLKTLKLLSQHTSAIGAAVGSFWLISKMVRMGVGPGRLSDGIETGERVILTMLLVWFTYQMLILLWKGRVKIQNAAQILHMVA
jgi:hypothetical protein